MTRPTGALTVGNHGEERKREVLPDGSLEGKEEHLVVVHPAFALLHKLAGGGVGPDGGGAVECFTEQGVDGRPRHRLQPL